MKNKTVFITGGTSGIGRETAVGLAQKGAHVVVSGRDQTRGEEGVADIKKRSGSQQVELILADMASFAEVRRMAAEFQERFDRLDVLINNVGYLPKERHLTVDGIEATLAVNHLAPFLLTHELLPLLKASAPSRVINVTGGAPFGGRVDFDNLQAEKSFLALNTYTHAKHVMSAASFEFARRLAGTGVSVNVAYPGSANTNMTHDLQPDMFPWFMRLMWPLFRRFQRSSKAEDAAVSSIFLASSPDVEGVSGKYFNTKGQETGWAKGLITNGVPERVWRISETMLGLEEKALI